MLHENRSHLLELLMPTGSDPPTAAPNAQQPTQASTAPRVSSRELLGGKAELIIEHGNREYRLRVTQSGKLILTA